MPAIPRFAAPRLAAHTVCKLGVAGSIPVGSSDVSRYRFGSCVFESVICFAFYAPMYALFNAPSTRGRGFMAHKRGEASYPDAPPV